MDNACYKRPVHLYYEINTSAVTVLISSDNVFLDIYAYMALKWKSTK